MPEALETRVAQFVYRMNEAGRIYDREIIAHALGSNWLTGHELCADMEWRGLLRRHGPKCSHIALTPRGEAMVPERAFHKAVTKGEEHGRQ